MRTRMSGGVGAGRENRPAYPITVQKTVKPHVWASASTTSRPRQCSASGAGRRMWHGQSGRAAADGDAQLVSGVLDGDRAGVPLAYSTAW